MVPRRDLYKGWIETRTAPKEVCCYLRGHLAISTHFNLQKAPCAHRFMAIEKATRALKNCDITGCVAVACAWHGCFAPGAFADMDRGEQQRHVDYCLHRAIETTNVSGRLDSVTLMYDIGCQYWVNFKRRNAETLPMSIRHWDTAIGLFHVHGHKEACLYNFSSHFIPRSGIVSGEILESLWSVLNKISPSRRAASHASWAELLDDHLNDNNLKKILNIGMFRLIPCFWYTSDVLLKFDRYPVGGVRQSP